MNDETLAHAESTEPAPSEHPYTVRIAPSASHPAEKFIHELFQEQVERTPDSTAVVHGERALTYTELNDKANQLARHLRESGVAPDRLVAVCMERSIEMVVGVLGVLKAGGAYVPLDPSYPVERLQHMVDDAAPCVVLTQGQLRKRVTAAGAHMIALDAKLEELTEAAPAGNIPSSLLGLTPANLVYVIYTSGSTGRPKGTAMPHRAVANLIEWHSREFADRVRARVLQFAALSFDVAFQEIFSTLCTGGTLVLLDEWVRRDPRALMEVLHSCRIDRLFLPPLMLRALAEVYSTTGIVTESLRDVITAGEQLRITPQIVELFDKLDGCRLHNHYGPTETHVVTSLTLAGSPTEWPSLPSIGRPIANTQIHLLDESNRPVPPGEVGEIFIGGANVARGYLNRPDLTEQRFVRDPYCEDARLRMYKTGDLGRLGSDGAIEYLGRNDDQMKIRGFRIEPGEIEAQLALHPGVREAAVTAREDVPGAARLVAYVTSSGQTAPKPEELWTYLQASLPDYMVPSAFVTLERLPLTPSGKLDRRSLPAPELSAYIRRQYEPPQSYAEEILAQIWQALLHVERVGRQNNFFELGGHSLLVAQMMERLRAAGFYADVRQAFQSTTLADLASELRPYSGEQFVVPPSLICVGCEAITPQMLPLVELEARHIDTIVQSVPGGAANVQDIYPLAPLQDGILFHHLLDRGGGDTYIVVTLLSIESQERLAELIAALQLVVDRHDVLRTAVIWEQMPLPVQIVYRHARLPIEHIVLDSQRDPLPQLQDLMRPEQQQMDIRRAPLLRLQIARWGDQTYALLKFHHIAIDHVTFELVTAEAIACLEGRAHSLPEATPYRNHVARVLAHGRVHDAAAFFRSKLGDVDEATTPFGLMDVHGDGARIEEAHEPIDPDLARRLRALAQRLNVSAATLFHAAWSLVVACTTGRDDVVFGSMLLGRLQGAAEMRRSFGMFINTLPLRLRLAGLSAEQLIQHTRREIVELLNHEQAPLAVAQRCSGIGASAPLFSSLLNYVHGLPDSQAQWSTVPGIRALQVQERTNYPITICVDDQGEGFVLTAQTDRRIAPRRVTGYLHAAMQSLVAALERAPQTPALALSVLPQEEWQQVVRAFNATSAEYPQHKLIHQLFEEQVERTPDAVALIHEQHFLSYAELNSRANQLAHHLQQYDIQPDCFVGLCIERGVEMVVGILGILKSGGAYVPLDPSYPQQRLEYILSDAVPKVVLTQDRLKERVSLARTVIALDREWDEIAQRPAANPALEELGARSDNLAYAIYTSGSTGHPKGVAIEHRQAVNLICWAHSATHRDVFDLTLHSTSLNFDLSIYECFVPLTVGGSIRVVENALAVAQAPAGVTLINTVPSAIKAVLDSGGIPPATRVVNLAGEPLKRELVERIFASSAVEEVCNLYGPSETTTYSTWVCMSRHSGFDSSIGRPIANTRIYLLDQRGEVVPIGVVGEIHIAGAGVARGYLNRPELTAARFLADPFSTDPTARMYKTGDLGRWRADGTIEYLGRNDHQVKIRGFRIELGEIEAHLARHAAVSEAVVLAREDTPDEKRLVAYVVARDPRTAPAVEELLTYMKGVLPQHMVPSAFVLLDRLPLTSNGKLDRRALSAPELAAYATRRYEAPQGEIEEILAVIWQELLGVVRVGRQDNFFELGGHSLMIVEMLEHLRRVGLAAEVRRIFECATLTDLAGELRRETSEQFDIPPNRIPRDCAVITPPMLPLVQLEPEHIDRIASSVPGGAANIQDIYPLVPLQEGILFHHLLNKGRGDTYVLPLVLSVSSRDRLAELVAALQAVMERHDVLRTAVLWEHLPMPVQVVYRHVALPVEEIALNQDRDIDAQIEEWLKPERQRLNLRRAPLLRLQVADPGSGQLYVLLQTHHLVIDHVTLEILACEVIAHLQGRAERLPSPSPYRNHVAQALAYARMHDARAFFRSKLAEIDEPTAPFGLLDIHGDGTEIEEAREELAPALAQRLRIAARRLSVSAATLFHAACGLVVARTSGRDDVVFGSLLLGRLHGSAGAQRILGMFINTLPLRLQLQGVTARELVERTQRELIELLSHEYASLAEAQRCSGVSGSTPLFSTLLNYRHTTLNPDAQWSSARGIRLLKEQEWTNYPITLSVDDLVEGFALTAQTDRRIDPRRILGYLRTAVHSLVEALETAPQTPALNLEVLPQEERRSLLAASASSRAAAGDRTVHELFESQVRRTPHAVAVICEGQSLTYRELNSKANQLAHYLVSRGAQPDRLIGIHLDRSLEMVVGLLAILKAGAAYLPLDPNYPAERLAYMLEDAHPLVVLTQQSLAQKLPATAALIALDEHRQKITSCPTDDLQAESLGLHDSHLAYVIYTSGSTGKPKGVMVEHRNVTRLFTQTEHWFRFDQRDVWTLFHSIAFDFAVWELWGALLYGGRLVVVPYSIARAPRDFYQLICEQGVTVLNQTPSAFAQLVDAQAYDPARRHTLRVVIFGGEALELRMLRPWIERNGTAQPQLVNMYGITETTVHVTYRALTEHEIEFEQGSPIGEPIPDLHVYLLNQHRQLVPGGVAGEMYVAGAGVARGYLHRPELTAQRFVADPFAVQGRYVSSIYRSGDLGRRRADGTLEYLGRNDSQVKIRGFRIEPGEIEAELVRHDDVKDAVVVAREDIPGEKRLVAYVTARILATVPDIESLRAHLKTRLPDYMVPSAFVVLERLPLTSNGKLDRRALPVPDIDAYARREYQAPQGETEQIIAQIWQELLHVECAGRDDDFFELGGHSLLAMQAITRVGAQLAVDLPMRVLFEFPTVRQFAARVDELRRSRLSQRLAEGGSAMEELLEQLALLPEGEVDDLLQQWKMEGRL